MKITKKRYLFIALSIVIISFILIGSLSKVVNRLFSNNDKMTSYGDIVDNIETIDYYLYENCEQETKHIAMSYFSINDYFLLKEEFLEIEKYLNQKDHLFKDNLDSNQVTCNKETKKILQITLFDGEKYFLSSLKKNKEVNEVVDYVEKYLNNVLEEYQKKVPSNLEKIGVQAFKASNIQSITMSDYFGWTLDNDALLGYEMLLQENQVKFSNDWKYYSPYQEEEILETNKWHTLLSYIQNNIAIIPENDIVCFDGKSDIITIKLNNNQTYQLKSSCGGGEETKKFLEILENTVGKERIEKYVTNAKNYQMGKDIINYPIEEIVISDGEITLDIKENMITFTLDGQNPQVYSLPSEKWEQIKNYLNTISQENNQDTIDKMISIKRSNGIIYQSDFYNKFFRKNTYNEIIKIIGQDIYDSYVKKLYE